MTQLNPKWREDFSVWVDGVPENLAAVSGITGIPETDLCLSYQLELEGAPDPDGFPDPPGGMEWDPEREVMHILIQVFAVEVQLASESGQAVADVEPKSITPKTKKVFQEFLMNSGWAERESPDGTTVLKSGDGCSATFADTVVTLRVPRTPHDEEASSDAFQRTSMIACELAAELGLGVYFPFDGSWATISTN